MIQKIWADLEICPHRESGRDLGDEFGSSLAIIKRRHPCGIDREQRTACISCLRGSQNIPRELHWGIFALAVAR
jgi:hypothetical protein